MIKIENNSNKNLTYNLIQKSLYATDPFDFFVNFVKNLTI